jgi:5-oxoprolinase (ATP-hydrolysing) subunit A
MRSIDLNCDLGEEAGHDAELMPLITSANIACGAHAGSLATMRATVALAQKHAVSIGAHPGFADREHFGRRELSLGPTEIRQLVTEQIARLAEFAPIRHVKPHGALYNLAARDRTTAEAVVGAIVAFDPRVALFAPPASELAKAGSRAKLRVAQEVFADRTYQRDGTLTPRNQSGAIITDASAAVAQVLQLVQTGRVPVQGGGEIEMRADTICVHGDGPAPVAFATRLAQALRDAGIRLRNFAD